MFTLGACLWAWFWSTFPVNDGMAASWRAAEWQAAATGLLGRALARATVVGGGVWLLLRWAAARRAVPRGWVLVLAFGTAAAVLAVGAAGTLWFWRTRPLW
jgi:hypothetical protein